LVSVSPQRWSKDHQVAGPVLRAYREPMSLRAGLRSHRYVLIGVIGGAPLAILYFIWWPWTPTTLHPHLKATVGRCAPWVSAIHPTDCAYIARHPQLVLIGPWRPFTGAPGVRRIPADRNRKVDQNVGWGWYDIGIQLPGHRIVDTGLDGSGALVAWTDQRVGTVHPDDHWILDPHRD
jgi:hypothetical protein